MEIKKIKKTTLTVAIALFAMALTQKSYCTGDECADSVASFFVGAFGFLLGGAALCWLANPFLLFSWILIKRNTTSTILSAIAFLIALSFLFFDEIIMNEGGHFGEITSYEAGYWLWLCSAFFTLIGNVLIGLKKKGVV